MNRILKLRRYIHNKPEVESIACLITIVLCGIGSSFQCCPRLRLRLGVYALGSLRLNRYVRRHHFYWDNQHCVHRPRALGIPNGHGDRAFIRSISECSNVGGSITLRDGLGHFLLASLGAGLGATVIALLRLNDGPVFFWLSNRRMEDSFFNTHCFTLQSQSNGKTDPQPIKVVLDERPWELATWTLWTRAGMFVLSIIKVRPIITAPSRDRGPRPWFIPFSVVPPFG